MMETPQTKNISANIGRAAQYEIEGDSMSELRFLLFVAQDTTDILATSRDALISGRKRRIDAPTVKRYASLLVRISKRVEELVVDEVK